MATQYARPNGGSASHRSGASLVELVTVVGVIALLTGLLLPAVQKCRDAANKLSCQARLRNLALAIHSFGDTNYQLPVGCDYPPPKGSAIHLRYPGVGISWHTSILPFVEQDSLWRLAAQAHRLDPQGNAAVHHRVRSHVVLSFLCPAESRRIGQSQGSGPLEVWGLTSYVGVAGTGVQYEDGLFHKSLKVRMTDVTDGTSNTLLIGERPPGPNGVFGSWYSAWGYAVCPLSQVLGAGENDFTPTRARDCTSDLSPLRPGRLASYCDVGHFWSLHSAGANFSFADGSVRFISNSRSPLLAVMSTRSGGEVIPDS